MTITPPQKKEPKRSPQLVQSRGRRQHPTKHMRKNATSLETFAKSTNQHVPHNEVQVHELLKAHHFHQKIYEVVGLSRPPITSSKVGTETFMMHEPLEPDLGQALTSSRPRLPLRNQKQREESHTAEAS